MGQECQQSHLLGRAGKDPEVHILRRGTIVNLSLATSEGYKDNHGEWQERTEWHNLVGYQRMARSFATMSGRARCSILRANSDALLG